MKLMHPATESALSTCIAWPRQEGPIKENKLNIAGSKAYVALASCTNLVVELHEQHPRLQTKQWKPSRTVKMMGPLQGPEPAMRKLSYPTREPVWQTKATANFSRAEACQSSSYHLLPALKNAISQATGLIPVWRDARVCFCRKSSA